MKVTNTIQSGIPGVSTAPFALRSFLRVFQQEDLNFLLTNRIPRRYATLFMGFWSGIRSPALTRLSIAVWQLFADDLALHEAEHTNFGSLQECFTRQLRKGARPIDGDPAVVVSPCDAVVGAHGRVTRGRVFQAKGFPYTARDLFGSDELAARHEGGLFVTLRLKSNMYHRFHAPMEARLERVRYLSGDTWNVNPIALRRVERLFCKNERAVLELAPEADGASLAMVCVASILVASMEIHGAGRALDLRYDGPRVIDCRGATVRKGEELGLFRSGSTIVLFVNGPYELVRGTNEGHTIRMGEPLLRRTDNRVERERPE
ncbi:MAG TPA: archaetidylserine decarboxylase [Polyangiaceae bacterium]|nr:archaetidylserine decarboxylase [Polyangiaceae bacterium]